MKEMEPEDNDFKDFWIGLLYGMGATIFLWGMGIALWIVLGF